ncbi:hypothetical protein CEXT_711741 [Caerostris extrusa]|uniref:BTB domain-containing protein n=1 Tax=Caerostris extrusa TaxID=172846 RepID=A0AAV4WB11_CAEEX|nr:hypothetical protein CEXT_711741 [Caerostris extrusa]
MRCGTPNSYRNISCAQSDTECEVSSVQSHAHQRHEGTYEKCVEIPDVDADTMRRMLQYVYTDTLEELKWESASMLYAAADKYELLALKDHCSTIILKNNLSAKTRVNY